jgi:pimeloyl-ACP methyl ester carboxylesterase
MKLRIYGVAPFRVAVIHGGPGAGGEMAPVARRVAERCGVLEPIQTELSVEGQVEELRDVLVREATTPATLIGFSWGAWLSVLFASKYPALVDKIILVSSGAFSRQYVRGLSDRRMSRLSDAERVQFQAALEGLNDPDTQNKNALLSQLGRLANKADTCAPLDDAEEPDSVPVNGEIYSKVWGEADQMRRTGALLRSVENLTCPVVAIHGDYDPSLAAGVSEPLAAVLTNFRFVLLAQCGHTPWRERFAMEKFYEILLSELA